MPVQVSQLADFNIAECSGDMTVSQIAEFCLQFRTVIDSTPANLMIDLSLVEDFDSSALQLLLWTKKHLPTECQLQFIIADNDVVTRVLELYQLSDQLISIHATSEEESA